jgi:hypothetical protein
MPLDGSESRVQHMLMAEDAQLLPISTPFGSVNFVQVSVWLLASVSITSSGLIYHCVNLIKSH